MDPRANVKEVKETQSGVEKLIGMDLDKFTMPESAKEYYRLASYFFSYSVVGTAYTKLAQFPISTLRIEAKTPSERRKADKTLRRIKARERLVDVGIHYNVYGIYYISPIFGTKKSLVCKSCGREYPFNDNLITPQRALYTIKKRDRVRDEFEFEMICRNSECENYRRTSRMKMVERELKNADEMKLIVYHPSNIELQYNPVTGDEEYIYLVERSLKDKIKKYDHFLLKTMPWQFTQMILAGNERIRLKNELLYVGKAPTHKINGLPIPPIVRAFKNLYIRMKYLEANKHIADDMMIPLRMLFPVNRQEAGRPQAETINFGDWRNEVDREIELWRKNPTRIITMPLEIGSKDVWGQGKLLAMNQELRQNVQDILADIGIPIEFIYGGATWSRQNVSSIIMENVFKTMGVEMQSVLDHVSDIINTGRGKDSIINIQIKTPELVEALGKLGYLSKANDEGKVSDQTYLAEVGIDAHEERELVQDEQTDKHKVALDITRKRAALDIEHQRAMLTLQKEMREQERRDSLKDMLIQSSVAKGEQAEEVQKMIEMMKVQLNLGDIAHKRQIDRELEGEVKRLKVEDELMQQQEQQMHQQMLEEAQEHMTADDLAEFHGLPPEEQQAWGMMYVTKMQLDEFLETLPEDEQEELKEMSQEQKYSKLEELMAQEEFIESEDPAMQREQVKRMQEKQDYARNVEAMANVMNELHGDELARFQQRLMVESSELFTRVKKLADYKKIREYVDVILGTSDPQIYEQIIQEIETERPSLKDDIYRVLDTEQFYRAQAGYWASKLIGAEGTPSADVIIDNLNENAPDKFREMVFEAYSYMKTGMGNAEKLMIYDTPEVFSRVDIKHKDRIRQMADIMSQAIAQLPGKERQEHLNILAQENPTLHGLVAERMATIAPLQDVQSQQIEQEEKLRGAKDVRE